MNEWNGNPNALPEEGEKFLYNGEVFYWAPCDCGNPFCDRPLAYNEKDEPVEHMTIRIRGENQGKARNEVVMKGRGWTHTQLADEVQAGKPVAMLFAELIHEVDSQANSVDDIDKFFADHGIDEMTILSAVGLI